MLALKTPVFKVRLEFESLVVNVLKAYPLLRMWGLYVDHIVYL